MPGRRVAVAVAILLANAATSYRLRAGSQESLGPQGGAWYRSGEAEGHRLRAAASDATCAKAGTWAPINPTTCSVAAIANLVKLLAITFPAGPGDAHAFICPSLKTGTSLLVTLFDFGTTSTHNSLLEPAIAYIRATVALRRATSIEVRIIYSHSDADHKNCAAKLLAGLAGAGLTVNLQYVLGGGTLADWTRKDKDAGDDDGEDEDTGESVPAAGVIVASGGAGSSGPRMPVVLDKPVQLLNYGQACSGTAGCLKGVSYNGASLSAKDFSNFCGDRAGVTFAIHQANAGGPKNARSVVMTVGRGSFRHLVAGDAFQGEPLPDGNVLAAIDSGAAPGGSAGLAKHPSKAGGKAPPTGADTPAPAAGVSGRRKVVRVDTYAAETSKREVEARAHKADPCSHETKRITSMVGPHHNSPSLDVHSLQAVLCIQDLNIYVISAPAMSGCTRYFHPSCAAIGAIVEATATAQGRSPLAWTPAGYHSSEARFGCVIETTAAAATMPLSNTVSRVAVAEWRSFDWYDLQAAVGVADGAGSAGKAHLRLMSNAARGTAPNIVVIAVPAAEAPAAPAAPAAGPKRGGVGVAADAGAGAPDPRTVLFASHLRLLDLDGEDSSSAPCTAHVAYEPPPSVAKGATGTPGGDGPLLGATRRRAAASGAGTEAAAAAGGVEVPGYLHVDEGGMLQPLAGAE